MEKYSKIVFSLFRKDESKPRAAVDYRLVLAWTPQPLSFLGHSSLSHFRKLNTFFVGVFSVKPLSFVLDKKSMCEVFHIFPIGKQAANQRRAKRSNFPSFLHSSHIHSEVSHA